MDATAVNASVLATIKTHIGDLVIQSITALAERDALMAENAALREEVARLSEGKEPSDGE